MYTIEFLFGGLWFLDEILLSQIRKVHWNYIAYLGTELYMYIIYKIKHIKGFICK